MTSDSLKIPSSSQTVGPYFRIGLESMMERTPAIALEAREMITIEGQMFDRDGAPVSDAMLEFWSPITRAAGSSLDPKISDFPSGFRRAITGDDGRFSVVIECPSALEDEDALQAKYYLVLVFARGLLRHLLTRVYLGQKTTSQPDVVLSQIPEERRGTLIAFEDVERAHVFHWNVRLQGQDETVFFAW